MAMETPNSMSSVHVDGSSILPLARMLISNEMSVEAPKSLTRTQRLDRFLFSMSHRYFVVALLICVHALVFTLALAYYDTNAILATGDLNPNATSTFARATALVLHCDVAVLLLPICRTLISTLSASPLHAFLPSGSEGSYHNLIAWSMVFFAWVHAVAHWINYADLTKKNSQGFKGFLRSSFTTGPGWSGHIMLVTLTLIAANSRQWVQTNRWSRFSTMHHLYVLFFFIWSVHGAFAMHKTSPSASWKESAPFWQYWLLGGSLYLIERVFREMRGKYRTHVCKVIQHEGSVVEIQMKKKQMVVKVGQYIYLCCPEVSLWQARKYTLTSAPEEDFVSVHVQCLDQFTKSLAASLGCRFPHLINDIDAMTPSLVSIDEKDTKHDVDFSLRNPLPPVSIDGPFGHTPETLWEKDVAVLVAVGPNVTSIASILKSIWYRMNFAYGKTALRKVYFFWLCDDMKGFEWFKSLILAIEGQNFDENIEVHPYVTSDYKDDTAAPAKNVDVNEDIFAGLRLPTMFGPPNWDNILKSIKALDSPAKPGVFACGSFELMNDLRMACNKCPNYGFKLEPSKASL